MGSSKNLDFFVSTATRKNESLELSFHSWISTVWERPVEMVAMRNNCKPKKYIGQLEERHLEYFGTVWRGSFQI
jgi:hypothetical protein